MKASRAVAVVLAVVLIVAGTGAYLVMTGAGQAVTVTTSTTVTSTVTASQTGISTYSACFSPGGSCASQLIALISRANSSIHVMIYEFSNTDIANALVKAKQRGVDVKIIMDGSEAESQNVGAVAVLSQGGVPLKDYTPLNGILHDKVAIIDGYIVVTGSYNWSYSADNFNDENMLVLNSATLAAQYQTDFQTLWNQTSTLPG